MAAGWISADYCIVAYALDDKLSQPIGGVVFTEVVANRFWKELLIKFLQKVARFNGIDAERFWIVLVKNRDHLADDFFDVVVPSIQVPAKQVAI